jgi:hypothetical protein
MTEALLRGRARRSSRTYRSARYDTAIYSRRVVSGLPGRRRPYITPER